MPKQDIKKIIEKCILINAVEHQGKAVAGIVLGRVMAENPELRTNVKQVKKIIESEVKKINSLSIEEQKSKLKKFGAYEKQIRTERKGLADLPDVKKDFVVRFAPNPDGALTLGNARPAVLSDEYAKRYKGKFILRFDDTDPKIKKPEKQFYEWVMDDLKWLGIKTDKKIYQSKRLKIYYRYAEKLIKLGYGYVCDCKTETWRKLRDNTEPCPCRSLTKNEHLSRWEKMLNAEYKEGQAILRIKTDLKHPNLAVRDWPAMRIVDKPQHPMAKANVWPLYNFASAIDDYLLGITHILRGQEHSTNTTKQKYIYDYFNWKYPVVSLLGRFSLTGSVLSKSKTRSGIAKGEFAGWDDPRLGTLMTLRRRGFHPNAIRNIIVDIGLKSNDITISSENLAAFNKKVIDPVANRYFFVPNPVKIEVRNLPIKNIDIPLHPSSPIGDKRHLELKKYFYVDKNDFKSFKGKEVRLKDLCNIELDKISKFTGFEIKKGIQKIQWVPADYVNVRVIKPDAVVNGYGETSMKALKAGNIIQMERFGFGRVESVGKEIVICYGHR